MRGPAGVPEAHLSLQGLVAKQAVQLGELPDGATHREAIVAEDRNSRGIVAPVLEPAETLHQDPLGAALTATGQAVPEPMADPGLQYLQLSESRRMRSEEIHYLDHPKLGLVVRIDPLVYPEALIEAFDALNEDVEETGD